MAVTVDWVCSQVVSAAGGKLAAVGLPVTADSTNVVVANAVRTAAGKWLGITLADPTTVADADLAGITTTPRTNKLVDGATIETLYAALGNANEVDEKAEQNEQKLFQIQQGIKEMIGLLEDRIKKPYGPAVPAAAAGPGPVVMPNDPFNPVRSRVDPCTYPYPT